MIATKNTYNLGRPGREKHESNDSERNTIELQEAVANIRYRLEQARQNIVSAYVVVAELRAENDRLRDLLSPKMEEGGAKLKIDVNLIVLSNKTQLCVDECEGVGYVNGKPTEYYATWSGVRYMIPRESVAYFICSPEPDNEPNTIELQEAVANIRYRLEQARQNIVSANVVVAELRAENDRLRDLLSPKMEEPSK